MEVKRDGKSQRGKTIKKDVFFSGKLIIIKYVLEQSAHEGSNSGQNTQTVLVVSSNNNETGL